MTNQHSIGSIGIYDNLIPNPARLRRLGLGAAYEDFAAPDGETYRRVARQEVPGLQAAIEQVMGPVDMLGMGYRLNFNGEMPNTAIHSDLGWGTHAAVLYLSDGPGGGTALWRHRATGVERIDMGDEELLQQIKGDWSKPDRWEQTALAPMRLGRLVIYESALFHSRWPFEAFGDGAATGRLIAVAFFTPRHRWGGEEKTMPFDQAERLAA